MSPPALIQAHWSYFWLNFGVPSSPHTAGEGARETHHPISLVISFTISWAGLMWICLAKRIPHLCRQKSLSKTEYHAPGNPHLGSPGHTAPGVAYWWAGNILLDSNRSTLTSQIKTQIKTIVNHSKNVIDMELLGPAYCRLKARTLAVRLPEKCASVSLSLKWGSTKCWANWTERINDNF